MDFYLNWKSNFKFKYDLPHLFIIRGMPGSGKSYFSSKLSRDFNTLIIDPDAFVTIGGEYKFTHSLFYRNKIKYCYNFINELGGVIDIGYCEVLPTISDVNNILNLIERECAIVIIDLPKLDINTSMTNTIHNVPLIDTKRFYDNWEDWTDLNYFINGAV